MSISGPTLSYLGSIPLQFRLECPDGHAHVLAYGSPIRPNRLGVGFRPCEPAAVVFGQSTGKVEYVRHAFQKRQPRSKEIVIRSHLASPASV